MDLSFHSAFHFPRFFKRCDPLPSLGGPKSFPREISEIFSHGIHSLARFVVISRPAAYRKQRKQVLGEKRLTLQKIPGHCQSPLTRPNPYPYTPPPPTRIYKPHGGRISPTPFFSSSQTSPSAPSSNWSPFFKIPPVRLL